MAWDARIAQTWHRRGTNAPHILSKTTEPAATLDGNLFMQARSGGRSALENLVVTNPSDYREEAKEFRAGFTPQRESPPIKPGLGLGFFDLLDHMFMKRGSTADGSEAWAIVEFHVPNPATDTLAEYRINLALSRQEERGPSSTR